MRIASFNVKAKLSEANSGNMHNLTDFLTARDIDFCLLQEVGRQRDVVGDNPSVLNEYELIVSSEDSTNKNASVGFLIKQSLSRCVVKKRRLVGGRLFHITIKLPNLTFNLVNVYMPSGIEGRSPYHAKVKLACQISDKILDILKNFQNVLVGGDFNEVRTPGERSGVFGAPKILPRLIGRAGFVDLSTRCRSRTFIDSRGFGSSKIDRFLGSKSISKRITSYGVDSSNIIDSDHRLVLLEMKASRPYIPKKD